MIIMKKYDIVINSDLKTLITIVNEAMEQGYYPKGGILYVNDVYIQTICIRDL